MKSEERELREERLNCRFVRLMDAVNSRQASAEELKHLLLAWLRAFAAVRFADAGQDVGRFQVKEADKAELQLILGKVIERNLDSAGKPEKWLYQTLSKLVGRWNCPNYLAGFYFWMVLQDFGEPNLAAAKTLIFTRAVIECGLTFIVDRWCQEFQRMGVVLSDQERFPIVVIGTVTGQWTVWELGKLRFKRTI